MFWSLLCGVVFAQDPVPNNFDDIPTITVSDSRYEDIYVEKPTMNVNGRKRITAFDAQLFTYMNTYKHLYDKNLSIYNDVNITYLYGDSKCDYVENALRCGVENNHWTLKTHVEVGEEQATLSIQLFDERGQVIAQASRTKYKKIKLIKNTTTTTANATQNFPVSVGAMPGGQNCSGGGCPTGGTPGVTSWSQKPSRSVVVEEKPPTEVVIPPVIRDFDLSQAIMGLYLGMK